jgi:transcriptional regulator
MYIPKHFEITDREEIYRFIKANGFGQLISLVNGKLFSSHIPFLLSEDHCKLIGHISKQNPQWEDIENQVVMVTLEGPHDYISPSWYVKPDSPPTWNYQAIHIYGRCSTILDTEKLKSIVHSLTYKYESFLDDPWEPSYDENMLHGIVGIELKITEFQCKYKLSQNKTKEDRILVSKTLDKLGSSDLAQAMRMNEFITR